MTLRYRTSKRLHLIATAEGLLPEEYLLEHPEYVMTFREHKRWDRKVAELAAKRIYTIRQDDRHEG